MEKCTAMTYNGKPCGHTAIYVSTGDFGAAYSCRKHAKLYLKHYPETTKLIYEPQLFQVKNA